MSGPEHVCDTPRLVLLTPDDLRALQPLQYVLTVHQPVLPLVAEVECLPLTGRQTSQPQCGGRDEPATRAARDLRGQRARGS